MATINYEKFFDNCYVDHVKDTEQWHQLRGLGIGGSDAGIVMNVSQYRTPYELWEEKTGKVKKEFITNEAIEKGNALEPIMFNLFKTLYSGKYEVIDTKDISLSSKQYPFLRANLDGALVEKSTNKKGILEIKSSTIQNSGMLKKWNNDDLPITYYFQCLHYLYVTGFDFVIVYAILDIPWANKQETRIVEMYKEDLGADIEILIKTERWFWNKVVTKTPPPFLEKRNKNLM
ncbi:YqaJ viral recombinase family protein [uncultured Thomasclavelia sp.]|uniref:YqaJ viral recombinase family nuclease n=1 Tax=uncultured Thomasclavelia sp. TaxID=3025759 RepID=UPI0026126997|nr:YqaJ viral recombinase family protein [uncultured Thomasclavelia sp.]